MLLFLFLLFEFKLTLLFSLLLFPADNPAFCFHRFPLHLRVVVDSGHGAKLVESFDQHSFRIEISKSERTGNTVNKTLVTCVKGIEKFLLEYEPSLKK